MREIGDGFDQRARLAAVGLRGAGQVHPRDLGDLVTVSRVARVGRLALTVAVVAAIGGVVFAVAAVAAPAGLLWGTGAVLLVLLVATWLLCAHAGGHAWFVPVPAFVLAVVWAVTASGHSAVAGWWLVALSAIACGGGVIVAGTALRQRLRGGLALLPSLRGADGVAVTELRPVGVVRVGGETWSAGVRQRAAARRGPGPRADGPRRSPGGVVRGGHGPGRQRF